MDGAKPKKRKPSFKTYARVVFKDSLIASFPEIASFKDWRKRWLKIVVFAMCFTGLVYQTTVFLQLYLSYPTVLVIETSSPNLIEQPAISICNKNKRRRSVVCDKPGCVCKPMLFQLMCYYHPRYCPNYGDPKLYLKVAYAETVNAPPCTETEKSWEEAEAQSHKNDTIASCKKSSAKMQDTAECRKPYRRSPARENNHPFGQNICYTIESQIGDPNAQPTFHDTMYQMQLIFRLYPEEYLKNDEFPSILIAIHDRKALVNPYDGGFVLKGGKRYNAFVSIVERRFLPPPYQTKCVDYVGQWRKRNGTGPLNQKMCIEYCKMMSLKQRGDCMDRLIVYPHEEKVCEKDTIKLTGAIVKNCTTFCGNPCLEQTFEVKYEETNDYVLKSEDGDVHFCGQPAHSELPCEGSTALLDLYFNQYTFTSISHQPKFDSISLFSYLGGFLGIWVGLSLVSMFDLLETLVDLLWFAAKYKPWRKKKVRRRRRKLQII